VGVAVALGVGIEIDVVVVQTPGDVVLVADFRDLLQVLDGPERRHRRIDIRQAIVVPPSLPDVQRQERVGQAVVDHLLHRLGDLGIAASPDVEDEPARLAGETGRGLFVVERPILSRAVERACRAWHERHRRIEMRVQRVRPARRVHLQVVRRMIARDQQRQSLVEVEPNVAGREVVPAETRTERLRLDDAVAVPVVDAGGLPI